MSRQRQAPNLGRAAIQNMKEHAFTLFHPHRLAVAQHATIDGEITIAHFVAVWHPLRKRGFHRGLASRFQFFESRSRGEKVLRHVTTLTEGRLELFEYEKHLPVVAARLVLGLYINWPNLTAVLPRMKIAARAIMSVIEAETGRSRSE